MRTCRHNIRKQFKSRRFIANEWTEVLSMCQASSDTIIFKVRPLKKFKILGTLGINFESKNIFFLAKDLLHIQNQYGRQYQNSYWVGYVWVTTATRVWVNCWFRWLLCGLGIFSCCVGPCMFMLCCVVVMNRTMKVIQSNSSSWVILMLLGCFRVVIFIGISIIKLGSSNQINNFADFNLQYYCFL